MKEKGQVFGQSCLGLLAKYDQDTRSLKTFQLSLFEAEPESLETLPKSGMTRSGKLWEQTMWAHPTGENEYGLLHTPTAKANQMAPSMNSGWRQDLFPTPTTQGYGHASEGQYQNLYKKMMQGEITKEEMEIMLRVKLENHRSYKKMKKMWPTPNAWDGNRGALSKELAESGKHQITLVTAVKMWPTPTASERSGINPNTGKGAGLSHEVKMWPTPTASDNRDRGNLSQPSIQRRQEKGKQLNLSMVADKNSGSLNPTWVEWLMGYPIGWTDLKD